MLVSHHLGSGNQIRSYKCSSHLFLYLSIIHCKAMPPVVSSLLVCAYLFFLHVFFDEVWIHIPRVCTPDLPSAAQHSFILFESQRWNSRVTQAWKIPTVHCTTRLLSCSEHSPLLPFTVFTFQCSVEVSTLAAV